jgi:hypothetical protein
MHFMRNHYRSAFWQLASNFIVRRLFWAHCGIALALFLAYAHGDRGLTLLVLAIILLVPVNAFGALGLLRKIKPAPAYPNKYIKPLQVTIVIVWLIYILLYLASRK